ncbi:MAG: Uma2 family endonuclease [Rhodothermales bacterium]|nr:Uma2 family endonuclease [Rhodothermales bacterium]
MISQEAYLEHERQAAFKSEFYLGETFAMSGASWLHVTLASNTLFALRKALQCSGCSVFASDLRVHIPSNTLYTYPDLGIVCDETRLLDDQFDTLLNPTVLIEILSPSTEAYDRGEKFRLYRAIESLREYVLISQMTRSVEVYQKGPADQWTLLLPDPERDTIPILGHAISLKDLYEDVPLDPNPGLRRS